MVRPCSPQAQPSPWTSLGLYRERSKGIFRGYLANKFIFMSLEADETPLPAPLRRVDVDHGRR